MSSGAFLARTNISEMNFVLAEIPDIVAHNDELFSAT
jgi:hypothetical protein